MNASNDHIHRRNAAGRRTDRARATLVGGALLGSVAIAAGLTAQAVVVSQASYSVADAAGARPHDDDAPKGHAHLLLGRSQVQRPHATTKGS